VIGEKRAVRGPDKKNTISWYHNVMGSRHEW
jgi:hypothetical protein